MHDLTLVASNDSNPVSHATYRRWQRAFRLHTLDHRRISASRIVGTGTLLAIRAIFFSYTLAVWIFTIVYDAQHGRIKGHFIYFTYLCHTGLLAYLGSSTFHTLRQWYGTSSFSNMYKTLQLLHWLLFDSVLLFATVVTILFWSLIYRSSDYTSAELRWSTASVHALNLVGILVDMVVGAMVFTSHWSHSLTLAVIGMLYLVLVYINQAANGWFAYDFLDYKKHRTTIAPTIIGMFAGFMLVYYVIYGIQLLLDRVLPPRFTIRAPLQDEEVNSKHTQ